MAIEKISNNKGPWINSQREYMKNHLNSDNMTQDDEKINIDKYIRKSKLNRFNKPTVKFEDDTSFEKKLKKRKCKEKRFSIQRWENEGGGNQQ